MRTSIKPRVNPETAEFWAGCAAGDLRTQRCDNCGALRFPPQPMCPTCRSMARSWVPVAGRGTVYSFSVVTGEGNEAPLPGAHGFPFAVAIIQLECGVRMVTDFDTEDLDETVIGMPVEVFFEQINDEIALPRFRVVSTKD